jgi:hypothetical protein
VRIKFSETRSLYRVLDNVELDCSGRADIYLVSYSNECVVIRGCRLGQFTPADDYHKFLEAPAAEELEGDGVVVIPNMPCIISTYRPLGVILTGEDIYPHFASDSLKINNICGRVRVVRKLQANAVFNPVYAKCVMRTHNRIVGPQRCLSHLFGNLSFSAQGNLLVFRAFRSFDEFEGVTRAVVLPEVLEGSHVIVSMFCATSNLGFYVGVNDMSMLQWQLETMYGSRVHFYPRTDEQTNVMFFKIKRLNDVFPQYSAKNMVTCSITRRGVLSTKITCNDASSEWTRELHEELVSITKNIKIIVQMLL